MGFVVTAVSLASKSTFSGTDGAFPGTGGGGATGEGAAPVAAAFACAGL